MNNIVIIEKKTFNLSIDKEKSTLYITVHMQKFDKEEYFLCWEYFKNFWILAQENKQKYYMVFNILEIAIFPLELLEQFKNNLTGLHDVFMKCLNSSVLITKNDFARTILKPIISSYKTARPFTLVKDTVEAHDFFSKPSNNL